MTIHQIPPYINLEARRRMESELRRQTVARWGIEAYGAAIDEMAERIRNIPDSGKEKRYLLILACLSLEVPEDGPSPRRELGIVGISSAMQELMKLFSFPELPHSNRFEANLVKRALLCEAARRSGRFKDGEIIR